MFYIKVRKHIDDTWKFVLNKDKTRAFFISEADANNSAIELAKQHSMQYKPVDKNGEVISFIYCCQNPYGDSELT